MATSDTPGAHQAVAAFRLRSEPSILVTVAMAYEGLDVPEVAVVAALTHIRSRPWLEQMVARATRVDPNAGPYWGPMAIAIMGGLVSATVLTLCFVPALYSAWVRVPREGRAALARSDALPA